MNCYTSLTFSIKLPYTEHLLDLWQLVPIWTRWTTWNQLCSFVCVCVCVCVCVHTHVLSHSVMSVKLLATPWTIACQAPFVHEILQARILERVAISYSRVSSWPRTWTQVSCVFCTGRRILYHCAKMQNKQDITPQCSPAAKEEKSLMATQGTIKWCLLLLEYFEYHVHIGFRTVWKLEGYCDYNNS